MPHLLYFPQVFWSWNSLPWDSGTKLLVSSILPQAVASCFGGKQASWCELPRLLVLCLQTHPPPHQACPTSSTRKWGMPPPVQGHAISWTLIAKPPTWTSLPYFLFCPFFSSFQLPTISPWHIKCSNRSHLILKNIIISYTDFTNLSL